GSDEPGPRPTVRRPSLDGVAVEADGARGQWREAGDRLDRGGLARTVGANQAEQGPSLDLERDSVNGGNPAEGDPEISDREQAHGRLLPWPESPRDGPGRTHPGEPRCVVGEGAP